ncbi:hypothetical protein COHA_010406 [Chlorella ohadii]|uniref:Uncharacterized protein n=1 Tax=Chlorella ohadii TaxID=2649997 RepID=A0AAD5DCU5_9CHLO|nr:hypothetical protein COHA_010406 [Chlorella ohadii]
MSSSEGSASHLPALSGGSAASMAAPEPAILVSKVLTYSDVSTEVARTGRIVLPRIQVQQCLPELLRLCRAEHALPAVRSGGPVKLSVDLVVDDEAGRTWTILMKTWQNVVSGEHRPTFVLENTALQSLAVSQPSTAAPELPAPLPLSGTAQPAAAGGLPPTALAQAHAWLAAVLAQQEQERQWVEQYNRLLLLKALQQEQEQRQRLMAAAAMQAP